MRRATAPTVLLVSSVLFAVQSAIARNYPSMVHELALSSAAVAWRLDAAELDWYRERFDKVRSAVDRMVDILDKPRRAR